MLCSQASVLAECLEVIVMLALMTPALDSDPSMPVLQRDAANGP